MSIFYNIIYIQKGKGKNKKNNRLKTYKERMTDSVNDKNMKNEVEKNEVEKTKVEKTEVEKTEVEKTIRLPKFPKGNLGAVIGPSYAACQKNSNLRKLPSLRKNVITKAWGTYNLHKKKENITTEDPKTPYIELKVDEEGVFAVVKGDSDIMVKLTMFQLDKYHEEFKEPRRKMFHNFYTVMDHSLIPRLIGRKASTVHNMRTDAVTQVSDEVDVDDLGQLEKSFIKVDSFTPKDLNDFNTMVDDNPRSSFIGYPASEDEQMVKVSVNSFASQEAFQEFVDCLSDVLFETIKEIKDKDIEFSKR